MADLQRQLSNAGLQVSREEAINIKQAIDPYLGLANFPPEILQDIVTNFSYRDIIALCLVSSDFQRKICDDQSFWKMRYQKVLSEDTRGIRDFKKAYHIATLPAVKNGVINKKAWTIEGYQAVTQLFPGTSETNTILALQALDHRWLNRFKSLAAPILSKNVVYPGQVFYKFLAAKGDLDLIKWLAKYHEENFDDTYIVGTVITGIFESTDNPRLLDYAIRLGLQRKTIEELQEYAVESSEPAAIDYLISLYPPTDEQKETMLERAEESGGDIAKYLTRLFAD